MKKDAVLVYVFGDSISYERIKQDDEIKDCQYSHLVKKQELQSDGKGNGANTFKVFNPQNEVFPLSFGKWQLAPIIEAPFGWGGYHKVVMEVIDPLGTSQKYEFKAGSNWFDMLGGVKIIFQRMKEFEKSYLSHEHYELHRKCEELTRKNENLAKSNSEKWEEIKSLREKIKELTTNPHVHRCPHRRSRQK